MKNLLKQKIIKNLRQISWSREYWVVVILITLKLYMLSSVLKITFFPKEGAKEYFIHIRDFIFNGQPMELLVNGIFLITVGSVLASTVVSFLWKERSSRTFVLAIVNLLLSLLIVIDILHYRYFEGFVSINSLLYIKQVGELGGSISNLIQLSDFLFFVDIPFLLLLTWYYKQNEKEYIYTQDMTYSRYKSFILIGFSAYFLISHPIQEYRYNGGEWLFEKNLSTERLYNVLGLLPYHVYDGKKVVQEYFRDKEISKKDDELIQDFFAEKHQEINRHELSGVARRKNVIVVQLESIQNFLIDYEINGQQVMPNLKALKGDSLYFSEFYQQTAQGRTSDSELLVNTSLYPLTSGSAYMKHPKNTYDSIPSIYKENGYETVATHAFKASFWNRHIVYPNIGINRFYSQKDFSDGEVFGWALNDKDFLSETVDKLKDIKQPFYNFSVALTSHHPFEIPKDEQLLNTTGIENKTIHRYLQTAHYVDQAVGIFIEELKDAGLWDNSIVVFYGDHDSGIFSSVKKSASVLPGIANDTQLMKENKNIPLIIHLPNGEGANTYTQVVSHADLGPTLLELSGIHGDFYHMGSSLLDGENHHVVFRDGSFLDGSVIYENESGEACYNFETTEEIELEECEEGIVKTNDLLDISDKILYYDWIKKSNK